MTSSIDLLREQPKLRRLLEEYRRAKVERPDAEWHDRVMRFDDLGERELSRAHGILLAHGWIETRVHADAFLRPGVIGEAYRLTPEGARLLRSLATQGDDEEFFEESAAAPASMA